MIYANKIFELAQLAESSYADLNSSNQQLALQSDANPDSKPLFSSVQAEEFLLHWEVVSHQPDTDSGFSATLFKRKARVGRNNQRALRRI